RPILLTAEALSVNHRLPSGPARIPIGCEPADGIANSTIVPDGVERPIWFALFSVNQRFPSGPAAIPAGCVFPVGIKNSVNVPTGALQFGDAGVRFVVVA